MSLIVGEGLANLLVHGALPIFCSKIIYTYIYIFFLFNTGKDNLKHLGHHSQLH